MQLIKNNIYLFTSIYFSFLISDYFIFFNFNQLFYSLIILIHFLKFYKKDFFKLQIFLSKNYFLQISKCQFFYF